MTSAFVADDQPTNLGAPLGCQVADREIEGLRFGKRAGGLALAYHEVLEPMDVQTEGFGAPLAGGFAGGRDDGMEKG